jgi:hypothetical protein
MFNDKQMSNDLTAEEIRGMLTVPGVEPTHVEIGNIEAPRAKYLDAASALRALQRGSGD